VRSSHSPRPKHSASDTWPSVHSLADDQTGSRDRSRWRGRRRRRGCGHGHGAVNCSSLGLGLGLKSGSGLLCDHYSRSGSDGGRLGHRPRHHAGHLLPCRVGRTGSHGVTPASTSSAPAHDLLS
jgi:hypothetical protein